MLASAIEMGLLVLAVWLLVAAIVGLRLGKMLREMPAPVPERELLFGFVVAPYYRES